MAGFLTQYFFLFYCLLLAAVTAAMLLQRKMYREFRRYAGSMMIAGVLGIVVFPFAISDVFSSGRGVEALGNLSKGFAGYGERLAAFLRILADRTFGRLFWCLLLLAVWFLTQWIWGLISKGRTKKGDGIWMFFLPAAGYFLLAARMSPYLIDRYMMPLFPFVTFGGVLIIMAVLRSAKSSEKEGMIQSGFWRHKMDLIIWGLLFVCQIIGFFQYDGAYLYTGYALQQRMAEQNSSCPCICVYEGVGYYENLTEFMYYEKTLLVKPKELADRKEKESITSLDEVVLLVKPEVDFTETARIMEEYGFVLEKILWRDGIHGDTAGKFVKSEV